MHARGISALAMRGFQTCGRDVSAVDGRRLLQVHGHLEESVCGCIAVYFKPDGVGEVDLSENCVLAGGVCLRVPPDGGRSVRRNLYRRRELAVGVVSPTFHVRMKNPRITWGFA